MTTPADLGAYPTGDEPRHNLQRMFADTLRVEQARRYLDDLLEAGVEPTVIAVDLDRSAVVRRRGVGEKRRLVVQLHDLIRAELPRGATFLDSGSRDEGWVVLTVTGPDTPLSIAEGLRARIAEWDFRMSDGERVRLTASLGIVCSALHGRTGADLLWAAGEALWQAKLTRDAVHLAEEPIAVAARRFPITEEQRRALVGLAGHTHRSVESLFHEALQLLLENHAPRWHWIVDMGGPTAGGSCRRRVDATEERRR
jgi:GGDEF domain-containing protein